MSTIYLIDQSLLDDSGHHADYAGCLIEAAGSAGFKTVLAANRQFEKWLRKNRSTSSPRISQNSPPPLAAGPAIVEQAPVSPQVSFLSDAEVHCLFRNTTYCRYSDLADLKRMSRNHASKFLPQADLPWSRVWRRGKQEQYVRQFAADCKALFENVEFGSSDHVFFTTINELELLGLTRFLAQKADSTVPQWHVQFHFGLFLGRPPEYHAQRHQAEIIRQTFLDAMAQLSYQNLNLYTTSFELADQYNRLGVGLFETLPYPVSPQLAIDSWERMKNTGATRPTSRQSIPDPSPQVSHGGLHSGSAPTKDLQADSQMAWLRGNPPKSAAVESPLKIACPGGIRREKGQVGYLQELVNQAWETLFEPQKIQLVVQRPRTGQWFGSWVKKSKLEIRLPSATVNHDPNDSVSQPTHAAITSRDDDQQFHSSPTTTRENDRLDKVGSAPIIYLPHPLPRDEYTRFIREADIGLLFYDSRVYYSRRAGILNELLAAGKPVIVPSGCWLAEQIAEPNFRYATRIIEQYSFEQIGLSDVGWSMHNAPASGGKISFDHDRNRFQFEFEIPTCQQIGLSFDWVWPVKQGVYCQVDVEWLDDQGEVTERQSKVVGHRKEGNFIRGPKNSTANGVSVLFSNHSMATRIRGTLKNAFSDSTICVDQFAFDFIRQPDQNLESEKRSTNLPSGAVGLIVANQECVLAALTEIVENYSHYSATAEQFAQGWIDDHDPESVIHRLLRDEMDFSEVA